MSAKYYDVNQGTFFEGMYYEPRYPLNEKNMALNLRVGTAVEITEEEATCRADWGHGIYKIENGIDECLSNNWDSSG